MGSIRRRLIAALALAPSPVLAKVCDKERPNWDGTPVSAIGEAIVLFSTLPSLALIAATLIVLRYKSVWGGLAVVVAWTALVSIINSERINSLRKAAVDEGCIGPNTLFIAITIAICIAIVLYTAPRLSADKNGES